MMTHCFHCGFQIQSAKTKSCPACGLPLEQRAFPVRQVLTRKLIEKSLGLQKHSKAEFRTVFLLMFIDLLAGLFLFPALLGLELIFLFELGKMLYENAQRKKLTYTLAEVRCVEKKIIDEVEEPTVYALLCERADGGQAIRMEASQPYFDLTAVGDEFYFVILKGDTAPCLYYRKSQWDWAG